MNPMVPSDLEDFFPSKSYGHLMGWSTPVALGYDDLGYDVLDYDVLGYDVLDLDYDVVNLGHDVINKNKKVCGRRSRQISRGIFEMTW
jgi:hypothetical protein